MVDDVAENHTPLKVTRPNGSDFVVLSADDWVAIKEMIYLKSGDIYMPRSQ
ncbi:MAG: type II toxin-antitoxin system Phd/YefM family antitoxin [Magnetococcales bacterium]|nr:type II toxin-antitoxin system Phd/YefM family antitoxin [Magnetococcales bacterium]